MSSRIMHLAVSYRLERIIFPKNANNFRIGCILPDAVISADKKEVNTHFIKNYEENGKFYKYFDFYDFYGKFSTEILNDPVYLGYYFHLIQDNLFRTLLYKDMGMMKMRGKREFLNALYEDYGILNGYLTRKYGLRDELTVPEDFSQSGINSIYGFELTGFLEDMSGDFKDSAHGSLKIFTKDIIDEFIKQCTRACADEYECIKAGKHRFMQKELAFETSSAT